MTALWTVTALLSVIVVVNSVAVIALTRQVGLLHLRAGPQVQHAPQPHRGLQAGHRIRVDVPSGGTVQAVSEPGLELTLFGFVRPECGSCAAALPAFTSVAAHLPATERAVLVSDADEARTRAYLAAHGVTLPLVTSPGVLQANDIPGTPYAVVADPAGVVIAASAAISAPQLEAMLGQARRSRQQPAAR
jgi:hypothetical protein